MRPTTALRRAVIVVASATLCAGASAQGASSASPVGVGFSNAATAEPAVGGLQTGGAAADPAPGEAATSVSDLVDAAAARAAAAIRGSNAPGSPEGQAEGASPAAPGADPAPPTDQPASTPVPILTPDGLLMSYVVNAKVAGPTPTQRVSAAVRRAGGVVVQAWPQIGVVVAHSTSGSFRRDVTAEGGPAVASVGATRSVAVTEGTPGGDAATDVSFLPTGPDAAASDAASMQAGSPPAPGLDTTATLDTTTLDAATPVPGRDDPDLDPLETDQWNLAMIKADEALQWGLVNHVVPQAELLTKCNELATAIMKNSPTALASAIRAVNAGYEPGADGMQREIEEFGKCFGTADFIEGTSAFLEKRKAEFGK